MEQRILSHAYAEPEITRARRHMASDEERDAHPRRCHRQVTSARVVAVSLQPHACLGYDGEQPPAKQLSILYRAFSPRDRYTPPLAGSDFDHSSASAS